MTDRLQICFPSTSYLPLIAVESEVTSRLHPNLRAPIVGGAGKHRPPSHSSPTPNACEQPWWNWDMGKTHMWGSQSTLDTANIRPGCFLEGWWTSFLFVYMCAYVYAYIIWNQSGAELSGTFIAFTEYKLKLSDRTESLAELQQKKWFCQFSLWPLEQ